MVILQKIGTLVHKTSLFYEPDYSTQQAIIDLGPLEIEITISETKIWFFIVFTYEKSLF